MLSGYYGFQNLGDEAICFCLIKELLDLGVPACEIVLLSQDPIEARKEYKVLSIHRQDLFLIAKYLRKTKLLISGGGSLLQDVTSKRSVPYYLGLLELARLFRVPYVCYAQGIGPIQTPSFLRWVKRSYQGALGFTVRDEASGEFLRDLGVLVDPSRITADPVFGLPCLAPKKRNKDTLVFNLRPHPAFLRNKGLWVQFLKDVTRELGLSICFLPLGPSDKEIGESLKKEIPGFTLVELGCFSEVQSYLAEHSLALLMRLHGIILSSIAGCYPLGLGYDPKVAAIGRRLGIPVFDVTPVLELLQSIACALQDLPFLQENLGMKVKEQKSLSKANQELLANALGLDFNGHF